MDHTPQLVAVVGPLKGKRFRVTEDGLLLGREGSCDVVIPDQNVSREHARLLLHNGTVWVQDAGSRNGVYVNQKRVVRHRPMGAGDSLTIGAHAFTLEVGAVGRDEGRGRAGGAADDPGGTWQGVLFAGLLGALGAALALWLVHALHR